MREEINGLGGTFEESSILYGAQFNSFHYHCKTRENSNFWKKGKIIISVKIRNLFFRSRMTKRISPLESSREI